MKPMNIDPIWPDLLHQWSKNPGSWTMESLARWIHTQDVPESVKELFFEDLLLVLAAPATGFKNKLLKTHSHESIMEHIGVAYLEHVTQNFDNGKIDSEYLRVAANRVFLTFRRYLSTSSLLRQGLNKIHKTQCLATLSPLCMDYFIEHEIGGDKDIGLSLAGSFYEGKMQLLYITKSGEHIKSGIETLVNLYVMNITDEVLICDSNSKDVGVLRFLYQEEKGKVGGVAFIETLTKRLVYPRSEPLHEVADVMRLWSREIKLRAA
ncbi:hypothetical protein AB6D11_00225 [Vibrio splendidus]